MSESRVLSLKTFRNFSVWLKVWLGVWVVCLFVWRKTCPCVSCFHLKAAETGFSPRLWLETGRTEWIRFQQIPLLDCFGHITCKFGLMGVSRAYKKNSEFFYNFIIEKFWNIIFWNPLTGWILIFPSCCRAVQSMAVQCHMHCYFRPTLCLNPQPTVYFTPSICVWIIWILIQIFLGSRHR